MKYSKLLRYATHISKDNDLAKDIVQEYWLYMKTKKDVDILQDSFDHRLYAYRGLVSAYRRMTYNDTWYSSKSKKIYISKGELPTLTGENFIHQIYKQNLQVHLTSHVQSRAWDTSAFKNRPVRVILKKIKDKERLVPRYLKVFDLLCQEYKSNEIAEVLGISHQLVNYYRKDIRKWIKEII